MSDNLCFIVKDSAIEVVFPFQTPTSLTWEVMTAPENQRLEILNKYVDKTWNKNKKWTRDSNYSIKSKLSEMFSSEYLTLSAQ